MGIKWTKMNTLKIKATRQTKDKKMVKLTMIFHRTGHCRAKKVLEITGPFTDWNEKKECFKANTVENEENNKKLAELRLQYKKVEAKWESENREWSPSQWANSLDIPESEKQTIQLKSVSQVIDHLIEHFSNKKRIKNGKEVSSYSNVREYKFLKSSLCEFTRKTYSKLFVNYHFKNITEEFILDYTLFLEKRGARRGNKGAVINRLKKLRAVCNYADKLKIPGVNLKLFDCVSEKMQNRKFEPKTIPHEYIQKIEKLDKSIFTKPQQFHIDLFLFSFYTGGMANIDVAYLTWESIKPDRRIIYERIKYPSKITWYSVRGSFITKMVDDGYNPIVVANQAGNSVDNIQKHYYKDTRHNQILKQMNDKF